MVVRGYRHPEFIAVHHRLDNLYIRIFIFMHDSMYYINISSRRVRRSKQRGVQKNTMSINEYYPQTVEITFVLYDDISKRPFLSPPPPELYGPSILTAHRYDCMPALAAVWSRSIVNDILRYEL